MTPNLLRSLLGISSAYRIGQVQAKHVGLDMAHSSCGCGSFRNKGYGVMHVSATL